MNKDTQTALLVGAGLLALLFVLPSKPKTVVAVGQPTGTGGATTAAVIGGAVSIVDSLTGALAGQQTGAPSSVTCVAGLPSCLAGLANS
jgi:hypothetical protein